jgi:hypothetical protein
MDDFLQINENGTVVEDKKIEFRCIRGANTKTYMLNFENYVPEKEITLILKKLKKAFGTGGDNKMKQTDFGKCYVFNGDFGENIKQYLIDKKIVPENAFK